MPNKSKRIKKAIKHFVKAMNVQGKKVIYNGKEIKNVK